MTDFSGANNIHHMVRPPNHIFVFGSNEAGIHGRGSAYHARQFYGALQSVGKGRMGHAYAIPTKDRYMRPLPLARIRVYVDEFLAYARQHTELTFNVVEIGCGLAKYDPIDIAPMFKDYPSNVKLPVEFMRVLTDGFRSDDYLKSIFSDEDHCEIHDLWLPKHGACPKCEGRWK